MRLAGLAVLLTGAAAQGPSGTCATCFDKTCDDWVNENGWTCDELENDPFNCDCGGCECDGASGGSCLPTCYGDSCDGWFSLTFAYDCLTLEGSPYGCDCSGCECAPTYDCFGNCFGQSCDAWGIDTGGVTYTCDTMETYGCDCMGCECSLIAPPAPPPVCCEETCNYPNDQLCDDGGPGAQYSACWPGTDCADCGDRCMPPPPPKPPYSTPPPVEPTCCENDCITSSGLDWTSDGWCDDGGPGSQYDGCELGLGHDCDDCGWRCDIPPPMPPPPPKPPYSTPPPGCCIDDCFNSNGDNWNDDGWCDDGGPGSQTDGCQSGFDCADCGPRVGDCSPTPPAPPPEVCECSSFETGCESNGVDVSDRCGCEEHIEDGGHFCYVVTSSTCPPALPSGAYPGAYYIEDCLASPPAPPPPPPEPCPKTCYSYSCDEWLLSGYTCDVLSSDEYGCDCEGCTCQMCDPPEMGCIDDCVSATGYDWTSDGWCDDGGPGAQYAECPTGHDCSDCQAYCIPPPSPPAPPPPPPPECEDTGSKKSCKKAKKNPDKQCGKKKTAQDCAKTCDLCGPLPSPPPPVTCEDKKGTDWCEKKTKSAKKAKKQCGSAKKAKKCELTCCNCAEPGSDECDEYLEAMGWD